MNDRELLEMAAKAAGYYFAWIYPVGKASKLRVKFEGRTGDPEEKFDSMDWNPLNDDGEALRLAVRLEFTLHISRSYTTVYGDFPDQDFLVEECARRAIVRAAAEIGRAMP